MRQRSLFRSVEPTHIEPRPYQMRAIEAVEKKLYEQNHPSTLLVSATGTGKTIIAGFLARRRAAEGRTLFLAHRLNLIQKTAADFVELGMEVGVEQGDNFGLAANDPHVICASKDSLQGGRLSRYPKDYFSLIIVDECHHSVSSSYLSILNHFDAPILGITATPDRADKVNLGHVYKSVAFEYTTLDALTDKDGPFLSRPVVKQCPVRVDLSALHIKGAADYTNEDLDRMLLPHVGKIARSVKKEVGGRSTLGFAPMIVSAQRLSAACRSIGMTSDWTSGGDPDQEEKLKRFKAGESQVLWNAMLLTEGTDIPRVEAVVLCRPTKSRSLFFQIVGRGLRLCEEIFKKDCYLIDFDWICGEHTNELIKPTELLYTELPIAGTDEALIKEKAESYLQSGEECDILEAVERATIDTKKAKEIKERELKVQDFEERYDTIEYGLFDEYAAALLPAKFQKELSPVPATAKQISYLNALGIPVLPGLTMSRASSILTEQEVNRKNGLATYKQRVALLKEGYDPVRVRNITREEASKRISEFKATRKGVYL